jgi:hypothetical protein
MRRVYILKDSSAGVISDQPSILTLASSIICAGTLRRPSVSGLPLEIVAKKKVATLAEARQIERTLKQKKNPSIAIYCLQH